MSKLKEDMNCSGAPIAASPSDVGVKPKQEKPKVITRTKGTPMKNIFKEHYKQLLEAAPQQKVSPQQIQAAQMQQQQMVQQPVDKEMISNNAASELFIRCRNLATLTHFAHLSTDSYSEHQALATFYEDIVEKIDAFCEEYIGKYSKFINLPPIPVQLVMAIEAIAEMRDWIDMNRALITDDSSLQNSIDDIQGLINNTIYKLQKLK